MSCSRKISLAPAALTGPFTSPMQRHLGCGPRPNRIAPKDTTPREGPKVAKRSRRLAAVEALKDLSSGEHDELESRLVPISIARGETLIRQGDVADALYLVVSGRFQVLIEGRDRADLGDRTGQPDRRDRILLRRGAYRDREGRARQPGAEAHARGLRAAGGAIAQHLGHHHVGARPTARGDNIGGARQAGGETAHDSRLPGRCGAGAGSVPRQPARGVRGAGAHHRARRSAVAPDVPQHGRARR